jgi:hypothetical protein
MFKGDANTIFPRREVASLGAHMVNVAAEVVALILTASPRQVFSRIGEIDLRPQTR